MTIHCFEPCGTPIETLPPYPPYWAGGTPPVDPTIPYVFCPTIPSKAVAGTPDGTVRVTGQNLTASCVVFMDNVAMPTTFVSATELTFQALHSTETTAHTETIQVRDGATVIPTTCQFTYTAAPLMSVACPLVPATAVIGSAALPVLVNGQNFTPTCVVLLDGVDQATTFISPTQLRFTVDPTAETVRQAIVGVRDTATGVQAMQTCPFDFTIVILVPTLTNIWPDCIGYYDDGKIVTYTGTNFDATSVVLRGVRGEIPTTFVNATTLTTAADPARATVASFDMQVRNGPAGAYQYSNIMKAMAIMNPGLNFLDPATASIAGGPVTVEVLGTNFSIEATVMVDGVAQPTVQQSGGWLDVVLTPPAAPGVMVIDVRLGHQHPEGHDNVRGSPNNTMYPGFASMNFTWTA